MTRTRSGIQRCICQLGLAFLLASCASNLELVPLVPNENGIAAVKTSDLELTAKVQMGSHTVPSTLVPIEISIVNHARVGVYVSLADIELELESIGTTSEALPPQRIKARRPVGLGIDPASPFASQSPTSATGAASPAAGSVSDTAVPYAGGQNGLGNPAKREILDTAFWGGYIAGGGSEQGLVYFKKPPEAVERLRLRVRVRPRMSSAPVQILEIPYSVQG